MQRIFMGACVATLIGWVSILSAAETALSDSQVVDAFLKSLHERKDIPAELSEEAEKIIDELKGDSYGQSILIAESLRLVEPKFREALGSLGEEDFITASTKLQPLAQSPNEFLAAEATYFLARTYILQERFEEALPRLEDLRGKYANKTVRGGESLFLTGIAEGQLLRKTEAIEALTKFVQDYPEAPERMRVGAFRQLEMLKLVEEGTLSDVQLRMEFSRRRLSLEDPGKNTQEQQQKITNILTKLIKEAEERECQCKGNGQGQGQKKSEGQAGESEGQGQGEGKQGGQSGGGSKGIDSDTAQRLHRGGPQSPWSKLRDRDRDPVFNALKEKFPGRYQELIEQYYKSFENEDEG